MSTDPRDAVLVSVLATHQLRARIVDVADYCGHWFEHEPQLPTGIFHLIDRGACWVRSALLDAPLHLQAGDLLVFPRGGPHVLSARLQDDEDSPEFSTLICGEFEFAGAGRNPVLGALPEVFVVRQSEAGPALRELATVLRNCAHREMPGQQLILDKLADSLFVMAVCHFAAQSRDQRGLFAALADARLAKALSALHLEPGKAWRVESLAQVAGMSRTAFSLEFVRLMGVSPIAYLTEFRIAEARRLLRDKRLSVAAVADQLGYQSEAAFRRTFKRLEGIGPGQLRREAGEPGNDTGMV